MLSILLVSCLFQLISSQSDIYGNWTSGSTYYFTDNIDNGKCGYANISTTNFPFGYVVSANGLDYNNSQLCGACYQIKCVNASTNSLPNCCNATSVTVQVTDSCGSSGFCNNTGHFGLSQSAFNVC